MRVCNKCGIEKSIDLFCVSSIRRKTCKACWNAYMRDYMSKHPDKAKTQNKLYKQRHPQKYESSRLKHHYGITLDEYNAILEAQGGICAICHKNGHEVHNHKTKKTRKLAVDHCHKTGVVRGLLCGKCNKGIGLVDESTQTLLRMVEYLKEY